MAVGTVSTSILTDITNVIRYKAGVVTLYKPREMAAAVSALDGTDAGDYQEQPYMTLESGVLPESVFSDIAAAIRGQNGLSTRYQPGDMAAAILALEWDVGFKPRAVLTSLGTLEFNYVDGRHCYSGGVPVNAWEIDPAGYSSASARPYDSIKLQVKKVVIHSSWPQVGTRKADYLFNAFQSMTEVSGFENLSGITSAAQMFSSCSSLETIYATSFSNTGLSGSLMFNGCYKLVGGAHAPCLRSHLRDRQVRGTRLHALDWHDGPDPPPAPDERDVRGRHGHVLVPEPDLPVLHLHEPRKRVGPGKPARCAVDALYVQLLRVHDD